jgi:hypothetical protein
MDRGMNNTSKMIGPAQDAGDPVRAVHFTGQRSVRKANTRV